jgi:hypothetical protein
MSRPPHLPAATAAGAGLSPMAGLALSTTRRRRRRAATLERIAEQFPPVPWNDYEYENEPFVAVSADGEGYALHPSRTLEEAGEAIAEQVQYGWEPVAVFDLDSGAEHDVRVNVTATVSPTPTPPAPGEANA